MRLLFPLAGLISVALPALLVQKGWSDSLPAEVATLPVARHFAYPVGYPDGGGYYDAQPFLVNRHLGSDWNSVSGGASDLGDPVHTVAVGRVVWAGDAGVGWGNVVRVIHHVRDNGKSYGVESVYAHLEEIRVSPGEHLGAGDVVGTIGDAHGAYLPHLHFELRSELGLPLGPGYATHELDHGGYLDPTAFIEAHR